MQNEKLDVWKAQISAFHFPRWEELPEVDLYMDQVVGYLNQKLSVFCGADETETGQYITPTMINNYVKQKIIAAPVKKRYDRTCLSALIVLFCAKQVLSIGMTGTLIACCRWQEDPVCAYNRFCQIFEDVIHDTVSGTQNRMQTAKKSMEDDMLTATAIAFINKNYVEKLLSAARSNTTLQEESAITGTGTTDSKKNEGAEQA